jgi:Protein of unknown function (DUF1501)
MRNEQKFLNAFRRHPHAVKFFAERPYYSRRSFFQLAGAGVTGMFLAGRPALGNDVIKRGGVETLNKARNVIMIMLTGAPSHTDTFDLKENSQAPADVMKPETIKGVAFPTGILPKLATQFDDLAIVRSVRPWALQHDLGQKWVQIGRSPAGVLGDVAPNIGTIVAIEKENERRAGQVFPTFVALNAQGASGSGFLSNEYAPFKIDAGAGVPDTTNPDGQTRFNQKWDTLMALDQPLRTANPYAQTMQDYDSFYQNGRGLIFNNSVNTAFRPTADEITRYGSNAFGTACATAAKLLAADGGTRYIQINLGGWDMHQNIYTALPPLARNLDNGVSALINDLKQSGQFNETLIVMMGEFGRTTGRLNPTAGRDHYSQQFCVFAGAGVKGGRALGVTNGTGSETTETGWSRDRNVRAEDIEATIYSALGIDWGTVRYDDPLKRGFYYVPEAREDSYVPIKELWA